MAKVYAPNQEYSGVSASVAFAAGVGETQEPRLLNWFRQHGYRVEESKLPGRRRKEPPHDDSGSGEVAARNRG